MGLRIGIYLNLLKKYIKSRGKSTGGSIRVVGGGLQKNSRTLLESVKGCVGWVNGGEVAGNSSRKCKMNVPLVHTSFNEVKRKGGLKSNGNHASEAGLKQKEL